VSLVGLCFGICLARLYPHHKHEPRHFILEWSLPRREAIALLSCDLDHLEKNSKEMSQKDIQLLRSISGEGCNIFWATTAVLQPLTAWGHGVSKWLHHCPCCEENAKCVFKGRRAIEMSFGVWRDMLEDLHNLQISGQAAVLLANLDVESRQDLVSMFNNCKKEMMWKFGQNLDFWDSLPYKLLGSLMHYLKGGDQSLLETCRKIAQGCCDKFDASTCYANSVVTELFLKPSGSFRQYVQLFAAGGEMHGDLFESLWQYASSLLVMKRLEGRHHLLNLRAPLLHFCAIS
jgi:hypothetical protein